MVVSSAKLISLIDLPKMFSFDVQPLFMPSSITWNIVLYEPFESLLYRHFYDMIETIISGGVQWQK